MSPFFFLGSEPKHPAVARSTREKKRILLEQVRAPGISAGTGLVPAEQAAREQQGFCIQRVSPCLHGEVLSFPGDLSSFWIRRPPRAFLRLGRRGGAGEL